MQQAVITTRGERRDLVTVGEADAAHPLARRLMGDRCRHSDSSTTTTERPRSATPDAACSERHCGACFERSFRSLHPLAYKVGRKFRHDDTSFAEDVAQETLTRALAAWERLASHPNLKGWICLTATHVALELDRQRRRTARPTSNRLAEESHDERLADAHAVTQALAQLSSRQRHVVVRRYYLDETVQQTAERLQLTTSKVKDATHEAVTKLARILGTGPST